MTVRSWKDGRPPAESMGVSVPQQRFLSGNAASPSLLLRLSPWGPSGPQTGRPSALRCNVQLASVCRQAPRFLGTFHTVPAHPACPDSVPTCLSPRYRTANAQGAAWAESELRNAKAIA